MNTVLTHQSSKYQGGDILIINGEKSEFSGNQNQLEAQNLIKAAIKVQFEKKIPFFLRNSAASRSLKIYISSSRELVISSSFLNKDDKGRSISYCFYCNEATNPDKLIRLISDDSIIAGMQPNPSDLKLILRYLKFYNKRLKVYSFLGIGAVVAMFAIIKACF